MLKRFLLVYLCFLPFMSWADQLAPDKKADIFDLGQYYFQTVGSEQSIPLGIITALAQDQQGFIWIGTQKGLIRYDGYRFRHFKFDPNNPMSLGGDFVNTLWAAPDGKLWVGTRHDGISVYNPENESFVRHQQQMQNSISDNYINAITGDKQGNIWIGTQRGLEKYQPSTGKFTFILHQANSSDILARTPVTALMLDNQERLWVGTQSGLNILSDQDLALTQHYSNPDNPTSLANQAISSLFQAEDGSIWIGTFGHGGAWINPQGEFKRLSTDVTKGGLNNLLIHDINQPHSDEIWFASYGGGINVVDSATGLVKQTIQHDISVSSSLNHDSLGALLKDNSGLMWIGTWGNGLNLFNPKNRAFKTIRHSPAKSNSLSYPDVISISEISNGDIWIGTRNHSIDVIRPSQGVIKRFNASNTPAFAKLKGSIADILETANGDIWIATRQSGLLRYIKKNKTFQKYDEEDGLSSNEIKRIIAAEPGYIWIATGIGLDKLNTQNGEFKYLTTQSSLQPHLHTRVNTLATLADGTLFAGASNGLYQLKPNQAFLTRTTHDAERKDSLSHNNVLGLLVDPQQQLLVATEQGLDRLLSWNNQNSRFESINALVGLPNQALWANMQTDQYGRIWDGQNIINLNSRERRQLTQADGVDIGVNWYSGFAKTKAGTLLYAGSKGLLMIKPDRFIEWEYQPPLVISQLLINGRPYTFNGRQITFQPEMKSFSLEFSALDFSDPMKNQYAYKLDGYDPDWNYTSAENRSASYTNLSPGNYLLHIKGSNRRGNWSDNTLQLNITIAPDWYQTTSFKLIIFLLILALLYLIYFIRVYQLHRHQKALSTQVAMRTKELKQSNLNITTLSDIGNEISSTLDLDKILKTVYFHVNQMMDANVFCIGFYEPDNQAIKFKFTIERGVQLPEFIVSMSDKERLAVWCVENNKPIVINDFARDKAKYFKDSPYIPPKAGEETASVIYWPLIVGGKTIGTITVQSFQQNAYSKNHQDIIKTLASTTAIAMDNANAYAKAQQAVEIKSIFLANMSHEIRTPMHGILGMTKLISKTNLTIEQQQYIKNITISANTLLTVINDVLDFSKIEAGKMPIEKEPFSLPLLLNNIAIVMDTLARDKGLTFSYEIAEDTPSDFIGDIARINQILLNLCSNAIKFTDQGEIKLKVQGAKADLENYELQVQVIDQGIGITADVLPKLFHSFSQADTSTTRKYGGTGLGLAISRELARNMSGDISVKSQIGEGSCFTLSLPLPAYVPSSSDHTNIIFTQKPQLLLVDPEPDRAQLIQQKLLRLGVSTRHILSLSTLNKEKSIEKVDLALIYWQANIFEEQFKHITNCCSLKADNIVPYSYQQPNQLFNQVSTYNIGHCLQSPLSYIELYNTIKHSSDQVERPKLPKGKPLKGLSVLVAEDNPINKIIAEKLLLAHGAKVEIVDNGLLAIEQVNKTRYDVVLMDIQMPELDGTEATKQIRKNPKHQNLPIIAMTANVLADDVESYKHFGLDDHISKPVNSQALVEMILEQIKIKKQQN
jgi:signal transduction histidine kinase/ligand-binding sensor domain-containing protein/CheY-like chemotaxis protein